MERTNPQAGKKKIIYVEIIRITAILFVIFNHTKQQGYMLFTLCEKGSFQYWFNMFFSVITGIGVPLFFMLSGMLLIGKDEPIGYVWKKRILKYVVILFVFSLINYVLKNSYQPCFSIKDFLKQIYTDKVIVPYWFLYSYISFLIALPLIRRMARNMTDKEFCYLFGLQIAFNGVISILQYRLSDGTLALNGLINPYALVNDVVFYPLIGYYLGNKLKNVTGKMCLYSFLLALVSIAVTMYMTNFRISLTGELDESKVGLFYDSLRSLQVIFVFLVIRKLFENRKLPVNVEKVVSNLGGCVLGIYLIEDIFRDGFYYIYEAMSTVITGFIAIRIYVVFVFLVCWLIVALFRFVLGYFHRLKA